MFLGAPPTVAGVTAAGQGSSPIQGLALLPPDGCRTRARHCLQRPWLLHGGHSARPASGSRGTGPSHEGCRSGPQGGGWARTALTAQEGQQAAFTGRGGAQTSGLGTTRNNTDTPHAPDSRERHEGLQGLC